jgi:hypothetical protein
MKMEAVDSSERLVNFYKVARGRIQEHTTFHTQWCDDLKSNSVLEGL